jgi:hypothetical protein
MFPILLSDLLPTLSAPGIRAEVVDHDQNISVRWLLAAQACLCEMRMLKDIDSRYDAH